MQEYLIYSCTQMYRFISLRNSGNSASNLTTSTSRLAFLGTFFGTAESTFSLASLALSVGDVSGNNAFLQRSSWSTSRFPLALLLVTLRPSKPSSPYLTTGSSIPENPKFKKHKQPSPDPTPAPDTFDRPTRAMESLLRGWVLHPRVDAALGVGVS